MATTYKAHALFAQLTDELRKRVSDYASIVESQDANGFDVLTLSDGSAATTEDTVVIRTRPRDWTLEKDVIGNTQTVYTPSVIDVAVEAPASGVGLARFVSIAHALAIFVACGKRGTRLEYWEETNGTPPSATTFNTANKMKQALEPELYWPFLASQ